MTRKRGQAEALIALLGEDKVNELIERAQAGVSEIAERTRESAKATEALRGGWQMTVTGLNSALELAGSFGKAISAGMDLIRTAAQQDAVDEAFTRRFENATETVHRLRDAVGDALSDHQLREFATQFDRANVSIEDTYKVLNIATRASAETGRDLTEVMEILSDTIIGASDSDLEKLGIVADLPEATKAFAKEAGIAAENIDKSTESAAALQLVLTQVNEEFSQVDIGRSLTHKLDQASAAYQNLAYEATQAYQAIAVGLAEDVGIIDRAAQSLEGRVKNELAPAILQAGKDFDIWRIAAQRLGDTLEGKLTAELLAAEFGVQDAAKAMHDLQEIVSTNELAFLQWDEQIRQAAEDATWLERAMLDDEAAARVLKTEVYALHAAYGTLNEAVERENQLLRENANAHFRAAQAAAEAADKAARAQYIREQQAKMEREEMAARRAHDAAEREAARAGQGRGGGKGKSNDELLKELRAMVPGLAGQIAGIEGPVPLQSELERGRAFIDAMKMGQGQTGDFGDAFAGPPMEVFDQMQAAQQRVEALTQSFQAFGDTWENDVVSKISTAASATFDEISRVVEVFEAVEKSGGSTAKAIGAAVPGTLRAIAKVSGGLGAELWFQETLKGMADVAESATRFASYDYVGGSMFAASAALHFAAAAFGGSKGGGGGGGAGSRAAATPPRTPTFGGGGSRPSSGRTEIQIIMGSPTLVGGQGAAEWARTIQHEVGKHHEAGSSNPQFATA